MLQFICFIDFCGDLKISEEWTASVQLQCEYLLTYIMMYVFGVKWLWDFQRSVHVCNQFHSRQHDTNVQEK